VATKYCQLPATGLAIQDKLCLHLLHREAVIHDHCVIHVVDGKVAPNERRKSGCMPTLVGKMPQTCSWDAMESDGLFQPSRQGWQMRQSSQIFHQISNVSLSNMFHPFHTNINQKLWDIIGHSHGDTERIPAIFQLPDGFLQPS
jgi:hypothetical protein